jgi:hypothetical protein
MGFMINLRANILSGLRLGLGRALALPATDAAVVTIARERAMPGLPSSRPACTAQHLEGGFTPQYNRLQALYESFTRAALK